ncbi:hypothetical protein MYCTH_95232 [Thermothelomyces thermophilus ATCC 42464]|uniref:2EXR domain-containing protein n=1 Tax=Thermothelomyces thermophilus (strain ATCC 42464 / BCRC 31852 / DSM 1799) TaxID=573729 RepID=G2QH12_THET4|nr:uncharacterized protein MYCTH_95232 [Thermothelomyces thermophilus ATCC 42464]AEO58672.1 hypothetical protein MYCTH_95232 [Thermothelomyces thermophilus ATCC 42464]
MPKSASTKRFRARERIQPSRACAPRPRVFPFFTSLPAELRLRIYSLILHISRAIDVTGIWHRKPKLDLALLFVSKQIYAEAAHYFYSVNTFCLLEHCDAHMGNNYDFTRNPGYNWLLSIGMNALSIRNLHIYMRTEWPMTYYTTALLPALARRAPNVARLALIAESHRVLEMPFGQWGPPVWKMHPNYVETLSPLDMYRLYCALEDEAVMAALAGHEGEKEGEGKMAQEEQEEQEQQQQALEEGSAAEASMDTNNDKNQNEGEEKNKEVEKKQQAAGKDKKADEEDGREGGGEEAKGKPLFPSLRLLQLAGPQESAALDCLCVELRCRVQAIRGLVDGRELSGIMRLWNGVERWMRWYDAVPGLLPDGTVGVRRATRKRRGQEQDDDEY